MSLDKIWPPPKQAQTRPIAIKKKFLKKQLKKEEKDQMHILWHKANMRITQKKGANMRMLKFHLMIE